MDLYSGIPYWIAKNPLYNYFNPLKENHTTDVVIVGSGITGSLVANELCSAGIKCTVVDKRTLTTGSSTASTALLQYEIDTPMCELAKIYNEETAAKAFRACLQSITDIEKIFENIGYNPGFERVPSIFYASNRSGKHLIEREYKLRQKYNLPTEFYNNKNLYYKYGIHAPAALVNHASAQIDAYDAATYLLDYHMKNSELQVFSHTEITGCNETPCGYKLQTDNGNSIDCKYVVIAAGFEAGKFLPKNVMKLTSTYAIVSNPIEEKYIWPERCLLWETSEPYLYIRTVNKNRVIVGGEDIDFKNPVLRDKLLRKKVSILEKKIKKLFPGIPFKTDMAWCGTFSTTDDGLPFIGNWPGRNKMFYALGYGGNGITFSTIAAQIIKNKIRGIADDREQIFGFERKRND